MHECEMRSRLGSAVGSGYKHDGREEELEREGIMVKRIATASAVGQRQWNRVTRGVFSVSVVLRDKCTPFRRRRIKHHCSIKHHSSGLLLVERSPTPWRGFTGPLSSRASRQHACSSTLHAGASLARSESPMSRSVHSRDNSGIKFRRCARRRTRTM